MPEKSAEYRLAPEAKLDLEAIWRYTLEEWGLEQANRYTDELTDIFAQLAVGPQLGNTLRPHPHRLPQQQGRATRGLFVNYQGNSPTSVTRVIPPFGDQHHLVSLDFRRLCLGKLFPSRFLLSGRSRGLFRASVFPVAAFAFD